MPEHTSSAVLNRAATTEHKRTSLAERVWRGSEELTRGQLNRAAMHLRDNNEQLSPQRVTRLARAAQERRLRESDTDEWTTGELTANRISLVMLEMPFAAEAQQALDAKSPANRREREERVNATVQFNHDFAEALVAMPSAMLADFPDKVWENSRNLYDKMGMRVYSKQRFEGVARGVSKEVAFSRALISEAPEEWTSRGATLEEDKKALTQWSKQMVLP